MVGVYNIGNITLLFKLKGFFSVIILLTIFLPFSRCNQIDRTLKPVNPPEYLYHYIYEDLEVGEIESWVGLILFLWPSFLNGYQFANRNKHQLIIYPIEIILCLISVVIIYIESFNLRILWIGGWLALFSFITLLIISSTLLLKRLRNLKIQNHSS